MFSDTASSIVAASVDTLGIEGSKCCYVVGINDRQNSLNSKQILGIFLGTVAIYISFGWCTFAGILNFTVKHV